MNIDFSLFTPELVLGRAGVYLTASSDGLNISKTKPKEHVLKSMVRLPRPQLYAALATHSEAEVVQFATHLFSVAEKMEHVQRQWKRNLVIAVINSAVAGLGGFLMTRFPGAIRQVQATYEQTGWSGRFELQFMAFSALLTGITLVTCVCLCSVAAAFQRQRYHRGVDPSRIFPWLALSSHVQNEAQAAGRAHAEIDRCVRAESAWLSCRRVGDVAERILLREAASCHYAMEQQGYRVVHCRVSASIGRQFALPREVSRRLHPEYDLSQFDFIPIDPNHSPLELPVSLQPWGRKDHGAAVCEQLAMRALTHICPVTARFAKTIAKIDKEQDAHFVICLPKHHENDLRPRQLRHDKTACDQLLATHHLNPQFGVNVFHLHSMPSEEAASQQEAVARLAEQLTKQR